MDETNRSNPDDRRDPVRVDELRQRLRSLGYLDAGVDRFVLASVGRAQSPATLALLASLRIGVLAAVLLGPAAAIGLAARFPGLVTGPRDALVAAVFLGVLFGVFTAAAAFVAALLTGWITSRTAGAGERLARRAWSMAIGAGTIVSIASLTYLTLWWKAASGEGTWASPVWTAFALAVAAACSLLLGHAVTVTALAMTVARAREDLLTIRGPGGSWRASFVGTAVAFVSAVTLLVSTAGGRGPGDTPVPLTVASNTVPIVVLAVDGFDAALYERLRPGGANAQVPNLRTVFESARADLAPFESRDPAPLWMTLATGVGPERHGVTALETRRIAGLEGRLQSGSTGRIVGVATDVLRLTRPAVASNFERRAKTFWEIAEQAGLRTAVVNWWATWPAVGPGVVISDRGVLRLERGGPLDAEIAPPEVYETLHSRWPDIRTRASRYAQKSFARGETRVESTALPSHVIEVLSRSGELDSSVMQLADALAQAGNVDLLVVYLPGLDIAQFALLGSDVGPAPSEINVRVAALERYYSFLTDLTSPIIARTLSGRAGVFVLSQAGRQHEGPGLLAARGPVFSPSSRIGGTVLDAAPTILHALGIPVARDLDGSVLTDLFGPGHLTTAPVRFVDTYGARGSTAARRGDAPLDRETIERLRSLGYIR